ncbi:MAG: bifunctional 5,10-methylenetetrahydrofolate dehydrogenase/5,10-methenyltetrahydrofolate cyclohydrolase [Spirochaetes bacterium]|nr:bifunctional 5,10-methylenetetrahydrofolate dehydrogenase/5,10-methenyltetrahydrofolate cyclohydrolase [Spirochaetota bacterium]
MGKEINGKAYADKIYLEIREKTRRLKQKKGKVPHLSVIVAGDDPASKIYVNIKEKRAKENGMDFSLFRFKKDASEKSIIEKIKKINKNKKINGLIVQLPLPKKFNEKKIVNTVSLEKDVDGLHPASIGALLRNEDSFISCTPAGIMELIRSVKKDLSGMKAVIVGRSNIVGKPVSILLLKEHCTITICHSRTRNLKNEIKNADILVAAIGRPEFIKGSWIKKGAIVIDVGINRVEDKSRPKGYRILGDVEYKKAKKNASHITPVPGGVGPMTVAMLLKNTLKAFNQQQ